MSLFLGIESSCDECSASIIRHEPGKAIQVLSLSTFSQIKIHQPFGGVVPEIASRNHLETINWMIDEAFSQAGVEPQDLEAVTVTNRPGLVGALLVGVSAAKALAYAFEKPLVPVHHLEGHAASVYLEEIDPVRTVSSQVNSLRSRLSLPLPMLLAIVSGGHTNLYLVQDPPEKWPKDFLKTALVGRSRDDAAGEAFDKTAKLLGFPYPGGLWIDRGAQKGNPDAFPLPMALQQKATLDYSFSGLKTTVALLADRLKKEGSLEEHLPDLCASIQRAIVGALLRKIFLAIQQHGCLSLAVVGGVAANSHLRTRLDQEWKAAGLAVSPLYPKLSYCTDNAAMIAAAGSFRYHQGHFLKRDEFLTLNAIANPEV